MTECNAIIEANNRIYELEKEVERLNKSCVEYGFTVGNLEETNKELQERNNRQAQQLDEIFEIILARDWEKLNSIAEDMEKNEELLQMEFKCYEGE